MDRDIPAERRRYKEKLRRERPWVRFYRYARNRCTKKGAYGYKGIECLLTVEEVKTLWFRDKASLMEMPSIDRVDNSSDYYFDNCRFIERNKNLLKGLTIDRIGNKKVLKKKERRCQYCKCRFMSAAHNAKYCDFCRAITLREIKRAIDAKRRLKKRGANGL